MMTDQRHGAISHNYGMEPNIIWNMTKYTGDGETYQSDVCQHSLSFHESLSFLPSAADPRVQGVRPVRVCLVAERVDIQDRGLVRTAGTSSRRLLAGLVGCDGTRSGLVGVDEALSRFLGLHEVRHLLA